MQWPILQGRDGSCELIREETLNVHMQTFPACRPEGCNGVGLILKMGGGTEFSVGVLRRPVRVVWL